MKTMAPDPLALVMILALLPGSAAGQPVVPFDPEYAPLSFVDDAGEAAGFDVAVARELARLTGLDIAFRPEFFSVIKSGRWPADWVYTVSSLSVDEERATRFDFIGPYYFDAVVAVVHQENPARTFGDMTGSRVAICSGCIYSIFIEGSYSTLEGVVERPFGDAAIVSFPSETDMLRTLSDPTQDRIDMAITSVHKADFFISHDHSLRVLGQPLFVEPVWIAVPKGRDDLLAALTAAFKAMRDDGTLSGLSQAHLGKDYTSLEALAGE